MRFRQVFGPALLILLSIAASAQRHYICYYAAQKPVIDGSDSDPVWQQAPWTEDFTDIEGDIRSQPPLRTRARLLWDSANLYVYAELQEPDLWGTLRQHDTIIYEDNDFEVFINPDNTTHRYFELEINALGTVMDLFMGKPYRDGGKAQLSWDTQGLLSAVRTSGTLNHPGDRDKSWSVEMAIPLNSLSFWGDGPVKDGTRWRINFSRVEWDRDVRDGQYFPRMNAATGRRLPEHNWVWSPQGIIDMHAPEKWAYLQFTLQPAGSGVVAFVPPADSAAREELWKIYYRQREHRRVHGRYAVSLEALGLRPDDAPGQTVKMSATELQYTVKVVVKSFGILTIDQDGEVLTTPEWRR